MPELIVTDLEASLRFYCDVLGFVVEYGWTFCAANDALACPEGLSLFAVNLQGRIARALREMLR